MNKILLSLFLIIVSFSIIQAQYTVKGTVLDEKKQPIEYAQVYFENTDFITESDEDGKFIFENVPFGNYILHVSILGFKHYEEQLFVDRNLDLLIVLEEKHYQLAEIHINASKHTDKMPFAFENMDKDKVISKNYSKDIPYLLQFSPSVVATSDAGAGIGYTGLRIRGTDATRINVTINGIPLNDPESQQVYWVDIPDISASADNIQIQRGVGTSTNGAGAFGATINIITDKLKQDPFLSFESAYGSYNTLKISANAGTGIMNGKYSLDARYTTLKSDGYIDRAQSALNSFYFSATRLFDNSSLKFLALLGKEKTYQAWYGVPVQYMDSLRTFNLAGTDYFRKDPPYDNQVDDYTQNHFQLFYDKKFNDNNLFNLALHYTRGSGFYEQYKVDEDLIEYKLDTSLVKSSDLIRQKWLKNDFYGLVFNYKYINDNMEWISGGAANSYTGDHFGRVKEILNLPDYDGTSLYYYNKGTKNDYNIYSKLTYSFHDNLHLYGDIQFRHVDYKIKGDDDDAKNLDIEDDLNFVNPKFGVKYNLNKHFSAYTSFSIANKEPNRTDYVNRYNDEKPKAERLYDMETGFLAQLGKAKVKLNFYNMLYKDQLVLTGKLDDVGNPLRENVADSYRRGVELDFITKPNNYLVFQANATYSKNKIDKYTESIPDWSPGVPILVEHQNTDIAFSPPLIAGMSMSVDMLNINNTSEDKHLYLKANYKYVAKQYIDNTMNENASLPAYDFAGAELVFQMKGEHYKNLFIGLAVNNLFNKEYVSNAWVVRFKSDNPIPNKDYYMHDRDNIYQLVGLYPQALRNYTLRMRVDF